MPASDHADSSSNDQPVKVEDALDAPEPDVEPRLVIHRSSRHFRISTPKRRMLRPAARDGRGGPSIRYDAVVAVP